MKRPLIGILTDADPDESFHKIKPHYARCVEEAGGLPFYIPYTREPDSLTQTIHTCHALLLTGGDDPDPALFGEKPHPAMRPACPERIAFEMRLIAAWWQTTKPLFAICLGAQMVNITLGGSLYQHIPSQVPHALPHGKDKQTAAPSCHAIRLQPQSRLHRIFQTESLQVNSSHQESAKQVGQSLLVTAESGDGIIEALEGTGPAWRLLVQWHPERMSADHYLPLFHSFIEAARP